jgi:2-dehydropantoate 2-reductase
MTPPNSPDPGDPAAPASLAGRPRVLVVGAGAIGGVIAAKLARAGHDVTALDANREHVARLTSPGLRLDELGTPSVVPVPAVADIAGLRGPFDFALLTLKAPFLEPVLTELASRGLVRTFVSLGNGLIQPRVAAITGPERLITGVVEWGATNIGPGHVAQTTRAPIILGRSGPCGPELGGPGQLAGILDAAAPTVIVADIQGHVWAKLLLNSTFSGLGAVSGLTYAQVVAEPPGEWLAYRLWTEGYDVAVAAGLRPGEVAGIRPADLAVHAEADRPRAGAALAALLSRLGPTKASMSQDLERGSPTEVDVINGAVVAQAAALGQSAPLNQRVVELVHECERGARRPGRGTLAALRAVAAGRPRPPPVPAAPARHPSPEPGARHG